MEILTTEQYNQAISKYKLLSSTAGVGSIITTKMGYYILVSDINKWVFVREGNKILQAIREEESDNSERYKKAKIRIPKQGISFIDDKRFVSFLKSEKNLSELICLVGIPSISLVEHSNFPNWKNHPINKILGESAKAQHFMTIGTHFPKWFKNKKGELKTYDNWKAEWIQKNLGKERFVPPRDASDPVKDKKGGTLTIKRKNKNQGDVYYPIYRQLEQTNLVLICPNGHLSDIPWPKFLKWKSEKRKRDDHGEDIFKKDACCPKPRLKWSESKIKSDGYGSIYIECENCNKKTTLEGINNLRPDCIGEKPWSIEVGQGERASIPREICSGGQMQVALVTGNNIYYAYGFSSLYVPQFLAENKSQELIDAIIKSNEKYEKYLKVNPEMTKEDFWDQKMDIDDFIIENGFSLDNKQEFEANLKNDFLEKETSEQDFDTYEGYRWQEYQCFSNKDKVDEEDLYFRDIKLPSVLEKYFKKVQQIEELKVTQVQLGFTRIRPKERIVVNGKVQSSADGQNIFSIEPKDLFVLPANETYGEGLFFQFREETINEWAKKHTPALQDRFKKFFDKEISLEEQGAVFKQKIKNNCYKHYLVHSFSHMVMRELEFSCGYPTASLKERLYISERMSGVLIYTAEGSEGSMGGVVWQGEPEKIEALIKKGLKRTIECSSDPLCWESEGQGIFDLNYAACFSCSLVSETACEEMNLGLDRRVLVDEKFGYFKELVYT